MPWFRPMHSAHAPVDVEPVRLGVLSFQLNLREPIRSGWSRGWSVLRPDLEGLVGIDLIEDPQTVRDKLQIVGLCAARDL
jgi:hypothetical protein